jgi:hypothetical protein
MNWIVVIVILLVVLFYGFWKWSSATSAEVSYLAPFTPTTLIPEEINSDTLVEQGSEHMKRSTVVLCGLIRDGEPRIPDIIARLELLGGYFQDYRILIVENDSLDQTRPLLLEWKKYNSRVTILGCGIDADQCDLRLPRTIGHGHEQDRIRKMAILRNLYIDHINEHLSQFNYLMVIDLDIKGSLYLDGVMNSFYHLATNDSIEAIGANGLRETFGRWVYYDPFCYIEMDEPFVWATLKESHDHDAKIFSQRPSRYGDPLKRLRSCFAGCALYRISTLTRTKARYNYPQVGYACEHSYFNDNFKMFLNPSMIYYILEH